MGLLLLCMVIHFVADFLMQSREMGQKKSSEFKWLFRHLWIQLWAFAFGLVFFVGPVVALQFAVANTLIHGIIDWHIWRLYKYSAHVRIGKKAHNDAIGEVDWNVPFEDRYNKHYQEGVKSWKYWEDHWFYSTIGFDQFLHTATIIALAGVLL